MKKLAKLLFLAVFLLMSLAPALGMLIFGPTEASANEILTQPPSVTNREGGFNVSVLNDASDYLRDRFWFRHELITANAAVEAAVFRESASEDVILGKEGWLYFHDTLDDYQGQNLLTDRQIWAAARVLSLIQEYAASRGVRTLFAPVPNKNTIYPEYMPDSSSRTSEATNYDKLLNALAEEGVEALDLRPVLRSHRDEVLLYQTLDSHWNNLGAALAHDAILEALGRSGTAYEPAAFTFARDHSADLYQMLYPTGSEKDLQAYPTRERSFTYLRPIRSPEDQRIFTACETGEGSLLMFRDSFGNTLHTFMAESFASACFSRAMPYDLSLLDSENPDTLILEITERHLRWLAERPPILPAPVRTPDLSAAIPAQALTLAVEKTDSGLVCLRGALPLQPDLRSPVYLEADGIVYEASPAGETERSFTAYLPTEVRSVRVFWSAAGVLYAAPAALTP